MSFATSLNNLAVLYLSKGDYAAAEPLLKQAMEIRRSTLGEQHPDFAVSLSNLAELYRLTNDYSAAEPLSKQALEIHRLILGERHPGFATSLNNLAVLYVSKRDYAAAEPLLRQAMEIRRSALGEQHPDFAVSLVNLAELYRSMGDHAAAEPLLKQVMQIHHSTLGERHPGFAVSLNNLAALYLSKGDYAAAEPLLKQAIEIRRSTLGEQHPDFAVSLGNLAESYRLRGDHAAAEPLLRRVMQILRATLGERHPSFAMSLNKLAGLYVSAGDYAAAEPLLNQAVEIMRTELGVDHPDFAEMLNILAGLYYSMGNYADAIPLYKQAMEIYRNALGEQHPDFATSVNNLGLQYYSMSDYTAAIPLYKQAMEIRRNGLGEQHPDFAISVNNLGMQYYSMGDYGAAEPLLKQAMEICRATLGEQHPNFATSLNNLALLYYSMGDYAAVEPLYKQAMEIYAIALGEQHPTFATSLNNLAGLYKSMGDYGAAEPLYKQAMEIRRNALGEHHPDYAMSLDNLAQLYKSMGDYGAAEPLYKQTMEILRIALGEYHPDFAGSLNNLARLFAGTNREAQAKMLMEDSNAIDDRMIGQIFSIASEKQRTAYLKTVRWNFDWFLSLVSQSMSNSHEATQSALSLVLRRKAIEAEALAMQRDAVLGGQYPEVASKLRVVTALRAQIAQKTLAGLGREGLETHNQILSEWEQQKENLEAELARQIPEINLEQKLRAIDREVVAMALPEASALIEFVRFDVFDFKAVPARKEPQWKPAHYLAFVLPAGKPDDLQMIDLGEAEGIDKMIATFRTAVTGEKEGRGIRDLGLVQDESGGDLFVEQGKMLRLAVFDKLLHAIGDRKRLFIAPDGDLTRLPFEILPADDGGYLIDKYRMSYLGVGRDVLRFGAASSGQPTAPMVAADPDFNLTDKSLPNQHRDEQSHGRVSRDLDRGKLHFSPLPGTRIEGESIAKMLGVQPMLEGNALESRLKACQSPRILHIATHGFFLNDQKRDLNKERRDLGMPDLGDKFGMGRLSNSNMENPLLRSGLALAGVNTWMKEGSLPEEAGDGILTAEDVTGLDLLATELVVLSACETGIGEVRVGEGVFGLRRAFVLAGAKTLVMSLWKVPDKQTQELMEIFYQKILNGQPRSEALREAQLEIREKNPHPLFWGAFICQGDPNQLSNRS